MDKQDNTDLTYLKDEQNEPLTLYHGTLTAFNQFYPLSHFGTKEAAEEAAYKLVLRDNHWQDSSFEQVANDLRERYRAYQEQKKIIPVHLKMQNPLYISDLKTAHNHKSYKNIVLGELEKDAYPYHPALSAVMSQFPILQSFCIAGVLFDKRLSYAPAVVDMIFSDPFLMDEADIVKELSAEKLFRPKEPATLYRSLNAVNLVYQRMIRFFERRGYDGFVYCNKVEDAGKDSYIIFRGGQVARLDRKPKGRVEMFPSVQAEAKLRRMEEKAFARCHKRPLTDAEAKDYLAYQYLTVLDIPKAAVMKDKKLQKLIESKIPDWKKIFIR